MSKKRLFLLFDCGFLFLFSISLVAVVVRPDIYARPVAYFILTCLTVGMIAAETIIVPEEHTRTALSLVKILLVGASLRLIPQLLYPGLFGVDPWMHQGLTSNILALGRIPSGTGYSDQPVFHLIAASMSLLAGLDYKMSVMTSIGFFNIFSPIFIFLIGRRLSSVRLGLLGALILEIADWYINTGFWTIPNTLGAAFILVIVFLQFRQDYQPGKVLLLSLIFSVVLLLTHTVSSLAMAMILLAFPLGQLITRKKHQYSSISLKFQLILFALFATVMLAYWTFVSGQIQILISALQNAFTVKHLIVPQPVVNFRNAHFLEFLSGSAGVFLFYILSLLGLVFSLRKMSKQFATMAVAGILVTAPAFLGYVFSLSGLYPQRWFLYSESIMAVFVAFGLLSLSKLGKSKKVRLLLVALTLSALVILSFFATTSPISNVDASIYTPDFTVRFFFTSSEREAVVFLQNLNIKKLYTDYLYTDAIYDWKPPRHVFDFSQAVINDNFSGLGTIALRQAVAEGPFYVPGYLGEYRLSYSITPVLDSNFSRVFDSGSVYLYTRPNANIGR